MMKLTDAAIIKVRELLDKESETSKLRVSVNGGGCSGFRYDFGFDTIQTEDDVLLEMKTSNHVATVPVLVDVFSMQYLENVSIDYTTGLMAQFVINNPNASSKCGCGSSFSV